MSEQQGTKPSNRPKSSARKRTPGRKSRSATHPIGEQHLSPGRVLANKLKPLIIAHRKGDREAFRKIEEHCRVYVRKFGVRFEAQDVADVTNMALGLIDERVKRKCLSAAKVAGDIVRALDRLKQRTRRAKKKNALECTITKAVLVIPGNDPTPEAELLRAEDSKQVRRIVRVIHKPLLVALELLNDRSHDLLLDEYRLKGKGIVLRGVDLDDFTADARRKAVRRARKPFAANLAAILRVEARVNPSPEVHSALKLISGDSLDHVLEYLSDR